MRSLEEWTKYLEQQEQALERKLDKQPSVDTVRPVERRPAPRPIERPVQRPQIPSANTTPEQPAVQRPQARPIPRPTPTRSVVAEPVVEVPEITTTPVPVEQDAVKPDTMSLVENETTMVQKAARMRKRLSRELLEPETQGEVAQSSYKGFTETREQLLRRLLDPQLSLEETARLLNVCPTTVRRYTNKGLLKHIRTAGNQRRFRLSDVQAFLESQQRGLGEAE